MPEGIPMKAGEVKLLKITDVKYKKAWTDQHNAVWHYHSIFVQDKQGYTARMEYYSGNEVLPDDLFVKGMWQELKCVKPDLKSGAHLIECVIDPEIAKKESRRQEARNIVDGKTSAVPRGTSEDTPPVKQQCQPNESVRTKTMAMAYAKDLLVTELQTRPRGEKVSEEDIVRMIGWGKKINDAFYEA